MLEYILYTLIEMNINPVGVLRIPSLEKMFLRWCYHIYIYIYIYISHGYSIVICQSASLHVLIISGR